MPERFEVNRVDRIADILFGVATARGLIGYDPLARRIDSRPDFVKCRWPTRFLCRSGRPSMPDMHALVH